MDRIPIFPLDVVVYPGQRCPLHIFEERYLLMVEECLETGASFGIALSRPDEPESVIEHEPVDVGTSMEVMACKRLADGRMFVEAKGRRRFRVERILSERLYQEADVEWLDEPLGDADEARIAEEQVRLAVERVGAQRVVEGSVGPVDTSYAVAVALDAPVEVKQLILSVPTAAERLAIEQVLLRFIGDAEAADQDDGADGADTGPDWGNLLN